MRFTKTTTMLLALAVAATPVLAKKDKAKEKADAPAAQTQAASGGSGSEAAAIVGGETITLDDLDKAAAAQLARIRQQEYQFRMDALQGMIQQKLIANEAASRKVSDADLLKAEVVDKSPKVTDDEVQKFFDANKARMPAGKTFDDVKGDISNMLAQQKQAERRSQFLNELQTKANVKIMLDPPRVAIKIPDGVPAIGPADAPIQLVEWSDYQCPFCKRAHPTVEQVLSEYKDKVRFVYLDYPLPFHQMAMPASEAAHCALEQGKFWEYHRNLFENAGDLSAADLSKRASDLGLDGAAFSACIESKKHDGTIQEYASSGAAAGVTGTPAFFINGRSLVGAQPIEQFRSVINEELQRKGIAIPTPTTTASAGTN